MPTSEQIKQILPYVIAGIVTLIFVIAVIVQGANRNTCDTDLAKAKTDLGTSNSSLASSNTALDKMKAAVATCTSGALALADTIKAKAQELSQAQSSRRDVESTFSNTIGSINSTRNAVSETQQQAADCNNSKGTYSQWAMNNSSELSARESCLYNPDLIRQSDPGLTNFNNDEIRNIYLSSIGTAKEISPCGNNFKYCRWNPDVYLLLNPDVKEAGAVPFSHYLMSGIYEKRNTC